MLRFTRTLGTIPRMVQMSKPLIAIVGATGTGKSDLAVELAQKYNGEIINGDAMQLYHGLPIITNKISQEEMKGIPHHLLGCISLEEETWTAGKFVSNALRTIDAIRSRGKLPILVGGTHFYTQSLLFHNALPQESSLDSDKNSERFRILDNHPDTILAKLREVDPVMADRWHPKDTRKIHRSLEIYLRTGKPASQIYNEQRVSGELSSDVDNVQIVNSNASLRFPSLILWVHASKDVLYSRLDMRVEKMLAKGLLSEVEGLTAFRHEYEARTGMSVDQTRGIWQSIGYKEFLEYQRALTEDTESPSNMKQLKAAAIEKTQAATRQYANRQIKWIRLKLLTALIGAGQKDNIFLLDGTKLAEWEDAATAPAMKVTEDFLSGRDLPKPCSISSLALDMLTPKREYDFAQRPDLWQRRTCQTCGTIAVTETDWNLHIKSRAHRRAVGLKKKQEYAVQAKGREHKELQTEVVDILESYMQAFPGASDGK